jgi:hypothetical protein
MPRFCDHRVVFGNRYFMPPQNRQSRMGLADAMLRVIGAGCPKYYLDECAWDDFQHFLVGQGPTKMA